jgi:hypothetical protein
MVGVISKLRQGRDARKKSASFGQKTAQTSTFINLVTEYLAPI